MKFILSTFTVVAHAHVVIEFTNSVTPKTSINKVEVMKIDSYVCSLEFYHLSSYIRYLIHFELIFFAYDVR